jgi:hypothetical protein
VVNEDDQAPKGKKGAAAQTTSKGSAAKKTIQKNKQS